MFDAINIHSEGKVVKLVPGKYLIYLLGGWGVELGDFDILFESTETSEIIEPISVNWPVQWFYLNRRAKRLFKFNIAVPGHYLVKFINPKSLKVRRSNLFLYSLITNPVPNPGIEILIIG